jgi:hypothetical protein
LVDETVDVLAEPIRVDRRQTLEQVDDLDGWPAAEFRELVWGNHAQVAVLNAGRKALE